jgi:hypothetical protein
MVEEKQNHYFGYPSNSLPRKLRHNFRDVRWSIEHNQQKITTKISGNNPPITKTNPHHQQLTNNTSRARINGCKLFHIQKVLYLSLDKLFITSTYSCTMFGVRSYDGYFFEGLCEF